MPLSALKFHFLQITFFSPVITQTHHLPTHTPFFRPIMSKKWALHLFLKITFFLLCIPSPYPRTFPNQLFRQTNDQKWSKNLPKEEIFFLLFFYNFFHIFPLPLRKKQNHLLFSPFLSLEIGKREGKMSFKKIFFLFFFLTFFHPTAPRNLKNYHLLFFFEIPT